ncbi:hypothetical protein BT93_J1376 [Corymbia citriodora subsp. variegata]|nr:hypothetical protein BT93_J1376 [Corymbia citriodora subsp. variegata]KAF8010702.1 hypothetical protein BT93_J1376 [Corymbia citriodora subsp. variegata]KAF8010703.1 hypothetical protein BT93_J1376 [Corymbia citriodora subsp. variegata]KAF8010709.1 hypothetical protein BT93_J1376 [Corymbia citriodora subsp. variegata]KAF8010713.1 hypothetical protein BT93_J1376 [Corymbia citriodora subsp. variegata]
MMQRLGAGIARLPRASPLAGGISSRGSCTKLFVGGLSYDTNEPVLKDAFRQFGDIIEVKVICDHMSGKSKGYGFVQFESEAAASTALNELDGKSLDGRDIRVHYAQKRNGGL